MYKGKKYNFIVVLLLIIISAVAGVSAGMNAGVISPGFSTPGNELPGGSETEELPEAPSNLKPPAASAKPLTKLLFAIDVLNNGKGFRSQSEQTLWINTLQVGQYMRFEKLSGGGQDLAQEWFKFSEQSGLLAGKGKNEYRVQYSDGNTMRTKTISNRSNFDFETKRVDYGASGKLESTTVDNYINVQNRFPLNDFFLNIDANSVGEIKEDKRSSSTNYIISVEINVSGLSQKYINTFTANGSDWVSLHKVSLTFEVSKTTGFLRKVKKSEHFSSAQGIFTGSCTTTLEETYFEMNVSKEAEINALVSQIYV